MQISGFSENQMTYQEMNQFLNCYFFQTVRIREQLSVYSSHSFSQGIGEWLGLRVNVLQGIYHLLYFVLHAALFPVPILNKQDFLDVAWQEHTHKCLSFLILTSTMASNRHWDFLQNRE